MHESRRPIPGGGFIVLLIGGGVLSADTLTDS